MKYYVYMLVNKNKNKLFSYVGYTNNIEKRIMLHNNSNGSDGLGIKKHDLFLGKKSITSGEVVKKFVSVNLILFKILDLFFS